MIRKLLYLTTLLAALPPCVALSADPSTGLSVSVVPSGGPSVPAGAAAAGFATLALSSDFTQQLPSNWLGGCAIAGSGQPWDSHDDHGHTWYLNLWWMWNYNSCWTVQRNDPAFGGLVLDIPWTVDSSNFNFGRGGAIETVSSDYNPTTGVGETHDFPNNAYYEVVMRMTPVEPSSFGAFVTWPSAAVPDQVHGGLEYDIIELDAGNLAGSDAAFHNWHSGGAGNWVWGPGTGNNGLPVGFDANKYHKFGLRTTSDGTTASVCAYIDDVFRQCVPVHNFDPAFNATQRYFIMLQSFCNSWNYPSNAPCNNRDGETQHMYVKSVSVWSCADWKTTQCSGTVLTGAP